MPDPVDGTRRAELIRQLGLVAPDPSIERVARIGAEAAGTPMALVTLVSDAVQHHVARFGVAATETPLTDAFCACAIDRPEVLLVPDATQDARVADSDLVRGALQVRSYAGSPICVDGLVLGTVCVMDRVPRQFDALTLAILADLSGIVEDVIRLRREQALRAREQRRAFDCAHAAGQWIWELDADGRLSWMAGETDCDCARQSGDTLGHPFADSPLLDWAGAAIEPPRSLQALLAQGRAFDGAITAVGSGIDARLLERCGKPLEDARGHAGWRGVSRDVTDRVRAEVRARDSDAAIRASRSKSAFLSRVSHELRTPLNGLLGYVQLIQLDGEQNGGLGADNRRRLEAMRLAGRQLLALINDMLDLARIEQGKFELDMKPVDAFEVATDVCALLAPLARDSEVDLRNLVRPGECVVSADRRAFAQILTNLMSNAIKYNRRSGIVTVRTLAESALHRVLVEDDGRGMSSAQLDALFQPFNRVGAPADIGGSGLGLVISKALAEEMGGRLVIESRPEIGTSAQLCLRAGARVPAQVPVPPGAFPVAWGGHPAGTTRTILYVEDNALNVLLLRELVGKEPGWTLVVATLGAQALPLAREHAPDLVLMDMQLPDMDGLQVFGVLEDAGLIPPLGCIALSADAMPDRIELARDAGFADYWTKPIDLRATLARMRALLRDDAGPQPTQARRGARTPARCAGDSP